MPRTQGLIPLRIQIKEIEKVYSWAGKMILDELLAMELNSDFQELKAAEIQGRINALIDRLNRKIYRWARESAMMAYKQNQDISRTRLSILGADINPDFSPQKHRQTVDRYIDLILKDFMRANQGIKTTAAMYFQLLRKASKAAIQVQAFDLRDEQTISELLDDAIREGASRSKLESLIRVHFERELYEKKFININGRNYDLIKYAKMVARTRLRDVQSEAIKNMCEQYDNDLVEISSHGTICEICQPYEGNVYSINGNTPGYPILDEWPGWHPNCEHSAQPTSEIAITWRQTH